MPLKVLHSPYRELIRPVVEYASAIRDALRSVPHAPIERPFRP